MKRDGILLINWIHYTAADILIHYYYFQFSRFHNFYSLLHYLSAVTLFLSFLFFIFYFFRGSLFQYDSSVSFWNFLAAGNYASRFYKYSMMDVTALQMKLQDESFLAVKNVEEAALKLLSLKESISLTELLTKATNDQGNKIVAAWRDLLPKLITK